MKNRTPSFIVCLFRKKERKEQKQKGKKNEMMIKIADVKSHFSKGVSFREFGTKFWQRLNSKFSIFTKKKKKSEFSCWHWNFLLPIHDLSGAAGVTQ